MKLLAGFAGIVVALLALSYFLATAVQVETAPPPERALPPKDPVSELVKLIDAGCKSGDWSGFDNACDLDVLLKRIMGAAELSEPMRECLALIVKGGGPLRFKEENVLRELAGEALEWKLVKVRHHSPEPRPVFRLMGPDGFLGYIEFVLGDSWAVNLRIVDVYIPHLGELASDYLRRLYVPSPEALKVLNTLRVPTPLHLFHRREELFRLMELGRECKWRAANEFYVQHRDSLHADKVAQLSRLRFAVAIGPTDFVAAFEEFEGQFPKDPSLPFLRISYLRIRGNLEKALEAVEALHRDLEDPYLHALRAWIYLEAGRTTEAHDWAKKCTDAEPALAKGWYVRLSLSLLKNGAEGAMSLLREGDKVCKLDLARMKTVKGFEEFSRTAAYKAWIESRPSR